MGNFKHRALSNLRIVSLTLSIIGLLIVLIEGYTQDNYNATRFILMVIFAWNIIFYYLYKPQSTDATLSSSPPSVTPEVK